VGGSAATSTPRDAITRKAFMLKLKYEKMKRKVEQKREEEM
jgi:hypothetical protein